MNIKIKLAFNTAQQVAKFAKENGSETAWATAQKHLAAAYGHARIEWIEKQNYAD